MVLSLPEGLQDILAHLIKERMMERKLSGNKLAKFANIDQGSLSKALARKINFSNKMIEGIARVFGENPQQMYDQAVIMATVRKTEKLSSSNVPQVGMALIAAELKLLAEHLDSAKKACELLSQIVAAMDNPTETVPPETKDVLIEIVDTPTS